MRKHTRLFLLPAIVLTSCSVNTAPYDYPYDFTKDIGDYKDDFGLLYLKVEKDHSYGRFLIDDVPYYFIAKGDARKHFEFLNPDGTDSVYWSGSVHAQEGGLRFYIQIDNKTNRQNEFYFVRKLLDYPLKDGFTYKDVLGTK